MSRRGRTSNPISLFSFQDIITSVTAIIILITLTLCLELLDRKLATPAGRRRSAVSSLQLTLADAIAEKERLQQELQRLATTVDELAATTAPGLEQELLDARFEVARLQEELNELTGKVAANKKKADDSADSAKTESERQKLAEAEAAEKAALEKVAQLKRENRRMYNQPPGSAKKAWLVDVAAQRFVAFSPGSGVATVEFTDASQSARVRRLLTWMGQREAKEQYFVLLVRPSGVAAFDDLQTRISAQGYDFGFDLIGEQQVIGLSRTESEP